MKESGATAARPGEPELLESLNEGVLRLTLNRPKARNALSSSLMSSLQAAIERAAADEEIRVVVVAGNGPAFCAGHDLRELRANRDVGFYEGLFRQVSRLMTSMIHLPKPVIAQVHGIATAAGCQLVASCDLAYAETGTRFATPGVNIGLFCSTPMVALSRAVGSKHALEMLLTGGMISDERAREFGLVNQVLPPELLDDRVLTVARQIAGKSPLTLAIGKEAFYRQVEMPLEDAYAYASEVMVRNMLAKDAEEGIDAFLEKRPPVWCGG